MEPSASLQSLETRQTTAGRSKIFSNRNFLLLWFGQGTSVIGDQFSMIALPWLVLLLTGDPVQLGIVLALTGVPRAVFMLVGGAMTDRFSQRSVMLASDVLRLLLTTVLAGVIFSGQLQLWMLYLFALAFGTVSAFFLPASSSIVPRIVRNEDLMTGNSIIQGTSALSVFIGPLLAGGLIALFTAGSAAQTGSSSSTFGIGLAIAIDALTFLVSAITLWLMRVEKPHSTEIAQTGIFTSIRDGLAFLLKTRKLLYMFVIIAALNFLFSGPAIVGIPVISNNRLAEGAAAFGIIMSAFAAGNLMGYIGSGAIKIKPQHIGLTAVVIIGIFGVGMALFGYITSMWAGAAILFLLGIMNGYISIVLITLLQKNTPADMMGRLMSLVMFSSMGLVPISQALAGFLFKISIEYVFLGCGILIVLLAIVAALSKEVRNFGVEAAD